MRPNDDERFEGRMHGPQHEADKDGMLLRLLYMIILWVMLQLALTVLGVATLVQYVIMLVNKGEPNERLAEFGESLGIWVAKAARYLTVASEVKPWPWTELD